MKKFTALLLFLCCLFYGCETLFKKNSQVAPECYQGKVIDSNCDNHLLLVKILNSSDYNQYYIVDYSTKDTIKGLIEVLDLPKEFRDTSTAFYFDIRGRDTSLVACQDVFSYKGYTNAQTMNIINLSTIKCSQNETK